MFFVVSLGARKKGYMTRFFSGFLSFWDAQGSPRVSKMVPKMMLKVIQLAGGLCYGVRKGCGVPCRLIWGSFRGHFGTFLIRSYVVFLVQPVFVVINLLRDCCDVPLRLLGVL